MRLWATAFVSFTALSVLIGCGGGLTTSTYVPSTNVTVYTPPPQNVVNSAEDPATPPQGTVTLRSALAYVSDGQAITFDPSLNGKTIALSIVGEDHTPLPGETYNGMTFLGYALRDYGKSALYADKNVVIDASALPDGVTIQWTGGDAIPARVLAVNGSLTLTNVTIAGGNSVAEPLTGTQPYTLARGGGLAVWGTATLTNCAIVGNRIFGDNIATRDRGALGGGIYSNGLQLSNCIVAGNSAKGYGAAGGGIYSVGGADNTTGTGNDTTLSQCTVSGNRVTGQSAYGGGVFTLSGGPNNLATMTITNCTIARNLVEDNPDLPETGQYYYRGGGVYLGGGSLSLISDTIAENEVTGPTAMFNNASNIGGGGVAATIGNAHVVENMNLQHTIVIGNSVNNAPQDAYTGSLINYYSFGYNRIGVLDFSAILVPAPLWFDLSRKHYPKVGDLDGLKLTDVLSLDGAQYSSIFTSVGTDAGQFTLLWYPPAALAIDQIPANLYTVTAIRAGYVGSGVATDDFLNQALQQIRTDYGATLGGDFGSSFGDLTGITFYGPFRTWPTSAPNQPWITFWRNLDLAIGNQLGTVKLGDDFWKTFSGGTLGAETMTVLPEDRTISLSPVDQRNHTRPSGSTGDIGAIEKD